MFSKQLNTSIHVAEYKCVKDSAKISRATHQYLAVLQKQGVRMFRFYNII
jgi:hypothetical protein